MRPRSVYALVGEKNKSQNIHISTARLKGLRGQIFTKFGTNVPVVDVSNLKFCNNLFKDFGFTGGGSKFPISQSDVAVINGAALYRTGNK